MKISERNQDLLFKLGIVVAGYFLFAKPILNFFGITKSAGDRAADTQQSNPNSPFGPLFWRTRITPSADQVQRAKDAAKLLYNAFGYITDNEDEAKAAFGKMKSQVEVSLLSDAFVHAYNKDMVEYLKKGKDIAPENGLGSSDLQDIITYVSRLPQK